MSDKNNLIENFISEILNKTFQNNKQVFQEAIKLFKEGRGVMVARLSIFHM